MSMSTRRIVYDDRDSITIQYTGQWFTKTSAGQDIGNLGPPYLYTLHGTNRDARIVFEFNGTTIEVYGTSILSNPMTSPDPTLECFVDGISIGREPPSEFPENNFKLCGKGGFSAGLHKLSVNIKVQSPNQTFWLDQIRYTPSPGVSPANSTIMLTNMDPAIRLDDNWMSIAGLRVTSKPNTIAHVDFIGTSVSWVGNIPMEFPHSSAFGTYTIDDGKPIHFDLAGLPENVQSSQFNQVFFTTPEVDSGPHTLIVTFLGSESTTPLTLDYLYINNGRPATSSSNILSTSTATTSSSGATDTNFRDTTNNSGKSGLDNGALLGGILGGLAFIIIVAGAFLYHRHRRLSKNNMLQPSEGEPDISIPFNHYSDSHPHVGLRARKDTPIPTDSAPSPANWPSAERRGALRMGNSPIRKIHGRSDGPGLPLGQSTTGDGFRQTHINSSVQPNERLPLADIPPHYTLD